MLVPRNQSSVAIQPAPQAGKCPKECFLSGFGHLARSAPKSGHSEPGAQNSMCKWTRLFWGTDCRRAPKSLSSAQATPLGSTSIEVESLFVWDRKNRLLSQAKSFAEKTDKQTQIITEAELARGWYQEKLAEVYLKLPKIACRGGPAAPENHCGRRVPRPNGSSLAVCESDPTAHAVLDAITPANGDGIGDVLAGLAFLRCCHNTHGLVFRGFAGITRGGQQQFATQTLRVHCSV